jgi:hypothetical protein
MHGPPRRGSLMTSEPKKSSDEPLAAWESEGGAPAEPKADASWMARVLAFWRSFL